MAEGIRRDLRENTNMPVNASIAMTHIDHLYDYDLQERLCRATDLMITHESIGPTRADVKVGAEQERAMRL